MSHQFHLDTNALIALADPAGSVVRTVREMVMTGCLPAASSVAWHEFVRGPLLPDELLRVERVMGNRIMPLDRGMAELAARLFNATGRRRSSTADCLIAACAINAEAGLLTADLDDFGSFVEFGLEILH